MEEIQIKGGRQTLFRTKEPSMYDVIMLNDDVTTMEFVVDVLMRIFGKAEPDAVTLMLRIHNEGAAVVGTYYRDIAESKALMTEELARQNGFPLKLKIEEAK